jgi:ABC-2 type transport system permease protein
LGVAAVIVMGAMTFSTFSLIVACLVKSRERFMGIGQLLTMPLFFASNAIYPIDLMPGWLKLVAHINPLTYQVDALRALMIRGGQSHFGLQLDFVVLAASFTLLLVLGARIYANLVK